MAKTQPLVEMEKKLKQIKVAQLKLVNDFVDWYYSDPEYLESLEDTAERFVAGRIGGIFELSDMYLNFSDVAQVIELKCSQDDFTDWYWQKLEKRTPYNLQNFLCLRSLNSKKDKRKTV